MQLAISSVFPRQFGVALVFAAGVGCGALIGPTLAHRHSAPATATVAPSSSEPAQARAAHPAEVLRVIDGDTFEARVHIWPGMDVTTKVRLRNIDAPEMSARCTAERNKAEAARDALAHMLASGAVGVSDISIDKYGGRVLALASSRSTADVSAALLASGHARRYGGGRRESWCD